MSKTMGSNVYTRSVVAVGMLLAWILSALTGFFLWLAPTGPRSGRMEFLLGLTKREWSDYHFYFSLAALGLTIVHLTIDWKGLKRSVLYLISPSRQ